MEPTSSRQLSSFALRTILEKDKLNGTNFTNWYRNLRIVLKQEKKDHVLDNPLPAEPDDDESATVRTAYRKALDESTEISCLMLAHMEPELQQQFKKVEAHDMIVALKSMFEVQARTERFNVSRAILGCRLREGEPLSPHVIKMVGYMQSMDRLRFPVNKEFATDIILNSVPKAYAPFISNYHMHGIDKEHTELHGMIKTAEADIKRGANQVLMVHPASKIKKRFLVEKEEVKGRDV